MKISEFYQSHQNLFRNNTEIELSDFKVKKDDVDYLWLTPILPLLDKYCMMNKYDLKILDVFVDGDFIKEKVADTLNRNVYKYNRLFNISLLDYNPLWNVDGTETRTIVHGAQSGSNTVGSRSDSTTLGARTDTQDYDAINGTNSNTHTVAGEDSNVLNAESADNSTNSTSARHDSMSTGAQTNNSNLGEQHNSFNNDTYTDVDTFVRGGNIGVTMSTQLLEAELGWLKKYDVIATIVNDVVSELCLGVY